MSRDDEEENKFDREATYAGLEEDSLSDMSLSDEGTLHPMRWVYTKNAGW